MPRNVFTVLDEISSAVQELPAILEPLAALAGGSAKSAPKPGQAPKRRRARPTAPGKKQAAAERAVLAPKARRAAKAASWRKSAGVLGGLMRRLSKAQQAEVRKVKDEKGIEAAIEAAKAQRWV